jgi:prepilin-type N-terminal cleavage/methylation domain-containing protein
VYAAPVDRRHDDAGFTLMELVISLTIMSVVMAIFTAGVLQQFGMYRATNAAAQAQREISQAFIRLDNELRYAAELRLLDASSLAYMITADTAVCHMLTLSNGRLQRQRWAPNAARGAVEILASGVQPVDDDPDGARPFAVIGGDVTSVEGVVGDAVGPVQPESTVIALRTTTGNRELRVEFRAPNTVRGPQEETLDDCLP